MPITETVILDEAGIPRIELDVPIVQPQKPADDDIVSPPNTANRTVTQQTTGGSLAGGKTYFYGIVAIISTGTKRQSR